MSNVLVAAWEFLTAPAFKNVLIALALAPFYLPIFELLLFSFIARDQPRPPVRLRTSGLGATPAAYKALIEGVVARARRRLPGAPPAARDVLDAELAAATARLADMPAAYEDYRARLVEAARVLDRLGLGVPAAKAALVRGETVPAMTLFARAAERRRASVQDRAAAAYQLGRLSDARIDFATATKSFVRAARLAPGEPAYRRAASAILRATGRRAEAGSL